MKLFGSEWRSRRRLMMLIKAASALTYDASPEFESLVRSLQHGNPNAGLDEIYIAIQAMYEIEGKFEDAVHSSLEVTDKEITSAVCDNFLAELAESREEDDPEIIRIDAELLEAKADHAYSSIRMAFALADLVSEESFGGLVRQGNKLNKGPISVSQRKRFWTLANKMEDAKATLAAIDEAARKRRG